MTSALKCNSCNIVIDELLAYIQNKISVVDEVSLIKICISAFKSEEIKRSKTLLFESLPTDMRKIARKKEGKENRDMLDIISLFKSTNVEIIPVFVARDLDKLPPITFDHLDVSKLLKDLVLLKADVCDIRSTYAALSEVDKLRNEIKEIKSTLSPEHSNRYRSMNINMKRGGYLDSGPMGLSHYEYDTVGVNESEILINSSSPKQINPKTSSVSKTIFNKHSEGVVAVSDSYASRVMAEPISVGNKTSSANESSAAAHQLTQARAQTSTVPVHNNSGTLNDTEDKWTKVEKLKRKNKYRYSGRTGIARDTDGQFNFKAAEIKVPIFITNIHKETTNKDITDYIYNKTKEKVVLEKISIKRQTEYNAYKLFVPQQKISMFLDDELWPAGIIFRRFVHFKHRTADMHSNTTVIGLSQ